MGMTAKIKALCALKEITQKELAEKLGVSQPSLSQKYKFDDWRESDLKKIAKICGCNYISYFDVNEKEI